MHRLAGIAFIAALGPVAVAMAIQPAPISENVEKELLPDGISSFDVNLNADLGFLFTDPDGTDVVHLIGAFSLTLGEGEGQTIQSREAIVWINPREIDGTPYHHLQLMLWRDVQVLEIGGTLTTGPALFLTLNSSGEIHTNVDDVAFESTADTRLYQEGNAARQAINAGTVRGTDAEVFQRVFDLTGSRSPGKTSPKPRSLLHVRVEGDLTFADLADGGQALTATGGVFLGRGSAEENDFLELTADSVVVFLSASAEVPTAGDSDQAGLGGSAKPRGGDADRRQRAQRRRERKNQQLLTTGFGDLPVDGAYLEGDIVMRQGPHVVRAQRLYYDFTNERAIILNAVFRTHLAARNLPLYIRADEIRQHSAQHFSAENAILTTSEFHTPHYHVGVGSIDLVVRSDVGTVEGSPDLQSGTFSLRHVTLNVAGTPVAYWPVIKGRLDTSETAVKSVRVGYSGDFGAEFETDWHLFHVLGYLEPEGFDATLSLDYFTERGPAIGVDIDYKRANYFGEIRSYVLDDGDIDNLGRQRETLSKRDSRGRILIRHRQYLKDDWEVSLELSYISDRDFLEEFFESEFDNDKEQETLLYLKKQRENWAFTAILQARLMDFTTQTERLPDISLRLIGQPLSHGMNWYSENRMGFVRYRPADQTFRSLLIQGRRQGSGTVARVDSRQEITRPLNWGPVRLVPFVVARGSLWDDSPNGGGVARAFVMYGMRGSMYFSKVSPDVRSELFDLHGIRHIIKPDFVAWTSHSNRDSQDLFPFDQDVERIDEFDGVLLGLRQRWQTKRGAPDALRTVDFLTFDVEAGFFNGPESGAITNGFISYSRPENSIVRNFVNGSFIWRINDRTALLSELNYDINDGEVDILNFSLAVERSPRLSYVLGYRFIEESESDLLGFDMNYRLTEKHTLAIRELFDLDRGRTLDFTVALIRKFPRWYGALSFALDESEDDFGVSISLWPEGLEGAALGSRRFTGLSRSTKLQRKR